MDGAKNNKNSKKKSGSLINLVEGTRRRMLGISSDENSTTNWVDTLILMVVIIVAFFLFS